MWFVALGRVEPHGRLWQASLAIQWLPCLMKAGLLGCDVVCCLLGLLVASLRTEG